MVNLILPFPLCNGWLCNNWSDTLLPEFLLWVPNCLARYQNSSLNHLTVWTLYDDIMFNSQRSCIKGHGLQDSLTIHKKNKDELKPLTKKNYVRKNLTVLIHTLFTEHKCSFS
jgi:hypothetical protein